MKITGVFKVLKVFKVLNALIKKQQMRIDIDRFKEILDTLTRQKSRTFLTGFGVFWGVFMLVGLVGGGDGLKEMLSNNFKGFATNTAVVFVQPTTKPYNGLRKGREYHMNYKDAERLKAQIPELDIVAPILSKWGCSAANADRRSSCTVKGVSPDYGRIETPQLRYGRYINSMDIEQCRKVCVLGKKVYKTLFPSGGNPCGQYVRIDSIYYNVVGVDYATGNISINARAEESIILPISLMRKAYNYGDKVEMICTTGKPNVKVTTIVQRMREVIARAHNVSPDDEKSILILNTEEVFSMMDNLFSGVNFLIWLVGIGTLLAGAIGVSNIMMVTVRERTTEIGIRRAIGATPKNILSQIMAESIVLTSVAGMSGILFVVLILQGLEMANTSDGVVAAHFQIDFWTAVGAVVLLSVLGIMAGLAPAMRAMSIKPVDAMRDE